jgi:hypothetical protein
LIETSSGRGEWQCSSPSLAGQEDFCRYVTASVSWTVAFAPFSLFRARQQLNLKGTNPDHFHESVSSVRYDPMMSKWLPHLEMIGSDLALVVALIFINYIFGAGGAGWLYPTIVRSRRAMRRIVKQRGSGFRVSSFGETHIAPQYLCVCIDVNTDDERDRLLEDKDLIEQLRQAILSSGYPAESVPLVKFSIESQETVDRDFEGSWWYARK